MLGAAFFYSLATVRLGSWAGRVPALRLAASKSLALALFALTWLSAYAVLHGAWHPGGHHYPLLLPCALCLDTANDVLSVAL